MTTRRVEGDAWDTSRTGGSEIPTEGLPYRKPGGGTMRAKFEHVAWKCPKCKRQKLRRLIGPGAAIVFKGSGFYKTDYRSDSYKKAAAADKSGATASNSESSKSSGNASGSDGAKSKEKKAV